MAIDTKLVELKDLTKETIPLILDYWFSASTDFLESMGVDPLMLPDREEMEEFLTAKVDTNKNQKPSQISVLVIHYDGRPIGFHNVNPLKPGRYGVFHAHICDPDYRRKGLGVHTYMEACRIFMDRFNLERILFKTPKQNEASLRVKEKLGIKYTGDEMIDFGIIKDNTQAKVFELTKEELQN